MASMSSKVTKKSEKDSLNCHRIIKLKPGEEVTVCFAKEDDKHNKIAKKDDKSFNNKEPQQQKIGVIAESFVAVIGSFVGIIAVLLYLLFSFVCYVLYAVTKTLLGLCCQCNEESSTS